MGIGGAVVAGIGLVIGLGVAADKTVFTHDLLHADFTTSAAPFQVGTDGGLTVSIVDGSLEMRTTSTEELLLANDAPFARVAYNVRLSADVVQVSGPAAKEAGVGVGCVGADGKVDYALVAEASGMRAWLVRYVNGEGTDIADWAVSAGQQPAAVRTLLLTCKVSLRGAATVTGSVNGTEVMRATDPDGPDGVNGAELYLQSAKRNTIVRYDNVNAVVPG